MISLLFLSSIEDLLLTTIYIFKESDHNNTLITHNININYDIVQIDSLGSLHIPHMSAARRVLRP